MIGARRAAMIGAKAGAVLIATALGLAAGGGHPAEKRSTLAFERDGHTWVTSADGTHQRVSQLPLSGNSFTWSPDGARVAYVTATGVFVANRDGSDSRRVAYLPYEPSSGHYLCFSADWSPDAEQLAWGNECRGHARNLVVAQADSGKRRHLAKGFADIIRPRWSPDGSMLLFAGRAAGEKLFALYVLRLTGGRPQRIPGIRFRHSSAYDTLGSDWDWSRDDRTIYVLLETQAHDENFASELLAVRRVDGKARLLTPAKLGVNAFALSPDGTRIALQAFYRPNVDDIYVMSSDGTHLRRLTHNGGEHPTWSPRGDKLAYTSEGRKNCCLDIYVINADGSAQRNLTRSAAWEDDPTWIP